MSRNIRLRTWLRANTHYANTHEFFVALLFECGAPPHPVDIRHVYQNMIASPDFNAWRDRLATIVSTRVHHAIDPTYVVQEYFKWLIDQQEKNHLSVH